MSPIELMQTRRLLLAKQLLTDTRLPVTEIAFASGFSSLRRFNDAFRSQYRMPPTRLRKAVAGPRRRDQRRRHFDAPAELSPTLRLGRRSWLSWTPGRSRRWSSFPNGSYLRTVRLGRAHRMDQGDACPGKARPRKWNSPARSRRCCRPCWAGSAICLISRPGRTSYRPICRKDPLLKAGVRANPGLRVPGAFDGFEMAVRAILGQQITVKAATTIGCRFAEAFGEKIATPFPELLRLTPLPQRVAKATVDEIASSESSAPGPRASSRWHRPAMREPSSSMPVPIRRPPSGGWWLCPASANGRRTTSPCGPSVGRMPFPRRI